ncbi:MAG: YczE/YyaS/YitT family protein [Lachnospiraceae bacterium]
MNTKRLPIRVVSYCFGLLLMAFGVTFSIRSSLGVSPVNSIPYVLSLLTGIDQGFITTGVFCCYVLIQAVILGKDFKPINLLQVVFASVFGYFVSFSNQLWSFMPSPEHYLVQLGFLGISMLLVALGLLFYLAADIVPQPAEGIMLAIHVKTRIEFTRLKSLFDTLVVVLAAVLSVIAFGRLRGIREGTLIAAVLIGKILGVLNRLFKKTIEDFLYNM